MVLLIALIGFGGCKKEAPGGAATAGLPPLMQPHPAQGDPAKLVMPAVLAHVPADTPYLLAGLDTMPPEVFVRFQQAMAPLFGMASAAWQRERATSKMLDAILSELDGKWSEAGIESLGLSAQPRFAVYGLGLQPVVARMAVKDDKAVQATIARIAAKAGEVLPPMSTKDGRNYWRHDDTAKGASFVIALADNQVIFAGGKTADVDAKLGLILGIDKPPQSMADGALIKQLMARHGFGGQMIGFVDSQRTVRAALEAAGAAPTPACTSEVDRMTATLPRV
ncbi:MAG: hypothetical protein H7138_04300, partial [Myxococcales bacterium]|nr:hypothetical protein [Myxococcales bacterium]